MYLNKAMIVGNLTKDVELKSLSAGIQVSSFSVATNRVWKDKNGAKQEAADYHNVVVFGKQAETCAHFLKKGSQVLVEGRLQTRSWDGQDGKKNYRTEIVADTIQFGKRPDGARNEAKTAQGEAKGEYEDLDDKEAVTEYPEDDVDPDSIPF